MTVNSTEAIMFTLDNYCVSEDKRCVTCGNNSISFDDDVDEILVFPAVCLVHLENISEENGHRWVNMKEQPENNIYGIDSECKIIWNIKQITAPYLGNRPDEFYTCPTKRSVNVFSTAAFRGFTFYIDVNTLEVMDCVFTK